MKITPTAAAAVLAAVSLNGQILDKLTKPKVAISLRHPPGLGLNVKRIAFGPASGECSDQLIDMITSQLVSGGMEVVDRQNLQTILAEQHFSLSSAVDRNSAIQLGRILGPTALVLVKVARCATDQNRLYETQKNNNGTVTRVNISRTRAFVRGSLQTVDLTTGQIFAAQTLDYSPTRENRSAEGLPEFPSDLDVKDEALRSAASQAVQMFVPWSEQKQLYFYNDKECNLKTAFELLKAGDVASTLRQSSENLETCKASGSKQNNLAHAYYNLGLMFMITGDYQNARANLGEAARLRGGDIVAQTMAECQRSEALAAQMKRVEQRTAEFESTRAPQASTSAPPGETRPGASIEERLRSLDSLQKKGLITKEEYERKKAQILKEM
ncbi:MAG: SHOCT domain-containing protein [Acidobacteria bacterium]|nr:SHOCT domain-containing protein [Acidobacteriota bacterium]